MEHTITIKVWEESPKKLNCVTKFDTPMSVEMLLATLILLTDRLKEQALALVISKGLESKEEIMEFYKGLVAANVINQVPETEIN